MDVENIVYYTVRCTREIPLLGVYSRFARWNLYGLCCTVFTVMTVRIDLHVHRLTTAAFFQGLGGVRQLELGVRDVRSYQGAWAWAQDPGTFGEGDKTLQVPHFFQFDLHRVPYCPSFASYLDPFSCR